jgi:endo-1,4-beta-mannosidase
MIDYIIITASHAKELSVKVQTKIIDGYQPVGGMNVVRIHEQLRYAGMQHKDTTYENEYSQAMMKEMMPDVDLGPL